MTEKSTPQAAVPTTPDPLDPTVLLRIGGREWTAGDKHRIYFNSLEALFGLDVSRYHTGNICGATLDGERLSNARAGEIVACLREGKLWWDFCDKKFHSTIPNCRTFSGDDMAREIVRRINRLCREATAGTATPLNGTAVQEEA